VEETGVPGENLLQVTDITLSLKPILIPASFIKQGISQDQRKDELQKYTSSDRKFKNHLINSRTLNIF
jgi:hypothetical protein